MLADFELTSCATNEIMRRDYNFVAHLSAISLPTMLSFAPNAPDCSNMTIWRVLVPPAHISASMSATMLPDVSFLDQCRRMIKQRLRSVSYALLFSTSGNASRYSKSCRGTPSFLRRNDILPTKFRMTLSSVLQFVLSNVKKQTVSSLTKDRECLLHLSRSTH